MIKTGFMALAIFFAGASASSAFAQQHKDLKPKPARQITHEMLVDQYNFPVKKHTGNPEKDQQVYFAEKQKWVAANQELYRRYNRQGIKSKPDQRRKAQAVLSPSK